ncbi:MULTISPECIES: DUF4238 domain-containing protein [Deefgea]|uniref:DUF4238 domain-containing protein n=1 Tax=Deefgea TaxID=400947 RepID=UPI0019415E92|nr:MULTISPECIES: DUF4238 domain-containing protein [Deefgea]MBM9888632.1 DUF4238 domain-containing protein [Deefgea sp. CFH1-16]
MINCHYVPRLILRHFANEEKIQYCDLDKSKVENRNIKSTFSEKGYYPDEIEKELCYKIESQFSNLLNNKILKERYKVSLSRQELFILKKYLIVTAIRFNVTEGMESVGAHPNIVKSYSKSFYTNINKVLACVNAEEIFTHLDIDTDEALENASNSDCYGEVKLWANIKNILHSYIAIVSTDRCKEDLIVPDAGFSYKATNIAFGLGGKFDKCMYTLNYALKSGNPFLLQMSQMLTPYDYMLFPVAKKMAIVSFSVFYKFFDNKSGFSGLLPLNGMTVSELIGFGSSDIVEPPKVKLQNGKPVGYEYGIKQLSKSDVISLNTAMFNTAEHYFGYCDLEAIKSSLEYYNSLKKNERRYDLRYILEP